VCMHSCIFVVMHVCMQSTHMQSRIRACTSMCMHVHTHTYVHAHSQILANEQEFATPIVKAKKKSGNKKQEVPFFTLQEYEEWRQQVPFHSLYSPPPPPPPFFLSFPFAPSPCLPGFLPPQSLSRSLLRFLLLSFLTNAPVMHANKTTLLTVSSFTRLSRTISLCTFSCVSSSFSFSSLRRGPHSCYFSFPSTVPSCRISGISFLGHAIVFCSFFLLYISHLYWATLLAT
jgi:hypothetical protein